MPKPLDLTKAAAYIVIIRAIHETGDSQAAALRELARRGLWLSDEQRQQAGLFECGCCGQLHRADFAGDCRDDSQRFQG